MHLVRGEDSEEQGEMVGGGGHKAGVQFLTGSDQWHLDIEDV